MVEIHEAISGRAVEHNEVDWGRVGDAQIDHSELALFLGKTYAKIKN